MKRQAETREIHPHADMRQGGRVPTAMRHGVDQVPALLDAPPGGPAEFVVPGDTVAPLEALVRQAGYQGGLQSFLAAHHDYAATEARRGVRDYAAGAAGRGGGAPEGLADGGLLSRAMGYVAYPAVKNSVVNMEPKPNASRLFDGRQPRTSADVTHASRNIAPAELESIRRTGFAVPPEGGSRYTKGGLDKWWSAADEAGTFGRDWKKAPGNVTIRAPIKAVQASRAVPASAMEVMAPGGAFEPVGAAPGAAAKTMAKTVAGRAGSMLGGAVGMGAQMALYPTDTVSQESEDAELARYARGYADGGLVGGADFDTLKRHVGTARAVELSQQQQAILQAGGASGAPLPGGLDYDTMARKSGYLAASKALLNAQKAGGRDGAGLLPSPQPAPGPAPEPAAPSPQIRPTLGPRQPLAGPAPLPLSADDGSQINTPTLDPFEYADGGLARRRDETAQLIGGSNLPAQYNSLADTGHSVDPRGRVNVDPPTVPGMYGPGGIDAPPPRRDNSGALARQARSDAKDPGTIAEVRDALHGAGVEDYVSRGRVPLFDARSARENQANGKGFAYPGVVDTLRPVLEPVARGFNSLLGGLPQMTGQAMAAAPAAISGAVTSAIENSKPVQEKRALEAAVQAQTDANPLSAAGTWRAVRQVRQAPHRPVVPVPDDLAAAGKGPPAERQAPTPTPGAGESEDAALLALRPARPSNSAAAEPSNIQVGKPLDAATLTPSDRDYLAQLRAAGGAVATGPGGAFLGYTMPKDAPVQAQNLPGLMRAGGMKPNWDAFSPANIAAARTAAQNFKPADSYGGQDLSAMTPAERSAFRQQYDRETAILNAHNGAMRQYLAVPDGRRVDGGPRLDVPPVTPSQGLAMAADERALAGRAAAAAQEYAQAGKERVAAIRAQPGMAKAQEQAIAKARKMRDEVFNRLVPSDQMDPQSAQDVIDYQTRLDDEREARGMPALDPGTMGRKMAAFHDALKDRRAKLRADLQAGGTPPDQIAAKLETAMENERATIANTIYQDLLNP